MMRLPMIDSMVSNVSANTIPIPKQSVLLVLVTSPPGFFQVQCGHDRHIHTSVECNEPFVGGCIRHIYEHVDINNFMVAFQSPWLCRGCPNFEGICNPEFLVTYTQLPSGQV